MDGRKKKGKHKKRRNRDGAFLVLAAGVAVLLVAALVTVILRVSSGDKSRETGNLTENTAESAGTEETAAGSIPAAEESVGTETEHTEEAAGKGSITAVAAEVGSMEDEEDPQKSSDASGQGSGTFAAITADTLKPEDGETAEATLGIDVSKYQGGNIDWTAVKEAGIDFVIVRVGYRTKATGIIYEDPTARYNMQEAQKNGIKVGAYFFSSAVSEQEAKEEASWLASFISQYRITYPVAYNCEDFKSQDSRQYGLDKTARTNIASAFLDTIQAAGYTPMFYASKNEMEGSADWDMDVLGSRYKIWVSQYPEKPFPDTAASTYSGRHDM